MLWKCVKNTLGYGDFGLKCVLSKEIIHQKLILSIIIHRPIQDSENRFYKLMSQTALESSIFMIIDQEITSVRKYNEYLMIKDR